MTTPITRRSLLAGTAAAGASLLLPGTSLGAIPRAVPPGGPHWDRILIMIELDGGNDGLNTIIPYNVAEYITSRPTLKYSASDVSTSILGTGAYYTGGVAGTTSFAMNPAMYHHLKDAWVGGDLAVLMGLGYDAPNLSHFRSMDIWNAGSPSSLNAVSENWLARIFVDNNIAAQAQLTAHGVLLSRYSSNPIQGAGIDYLAMSTPKEFCDRSLNLMNTAGKSSASSQFEHHLRTQQTVFEAAGDFRSALMTGSTYAPIGFSNTVTFNSASSFEKRCKSIAEMICTLKNDGITKARLQIPVFKVQIGGFDNHDTQKAKHEDLLAQVGSGIANLRRALIEQGLWDRVMIMTYSEFGRRVEENGSRGTDHGTVNCHLLCGGKVIGGFYGTQSGLNKTTDYSQWNMIKREDYRRLYATAATWLGLDIEQDTITGVDCLKGQLPFPCLEA